ncbi:MAG: hypothetical protein NT018_10530 [Armatimonadetes bacterium]|nr:hypothetical protein [Armatimonadota bacterium]
MRITIFAILLLVSITACAFAADSGIHSMVVGEKALELVENRQLTFKADGKVESAVISPDGKSIVYCQKDEPLSISVHMMKTSGSSAKITVKGAKRDSEISRDEHLNEDSWQITGPAAWLPDSKSFAVATIHGKPIDASTPKDDPAREDSTELAVILYTLDGKVKASVPIKMDAGAKPYPETIMSFSPDSRRFAITYSLLAQHPDSGTGLQNGPTQLGIIDMIDEPGRMLYSSKPEESNRYGSVAWSSDGAAVVWSNVREVQKISVSDNKEEKLAESGPVAWYSPDGRFAVVTLSPGVTVEDLQTHKLTTVAKAADSAFVSWLPGSQMLLYTRPQTIKDDSGKRTRTLKTLWLACLAEHSRNAMCIALDVDNVAVSSSLDQSKIAYTSQGRLYVAELEWRKPTSEEKADAGLKLTEDEEKAVLVENAKRIGVGLEQLVMEKRGEMPFSAAELLSYVGDKAFFRPGTDQMIFKFLLDADPWKVNEEGKRYIPGETVLGEFDAGYSWKIVVYLGGDLKVVQK